MCLDKLICKCHDLELKEFLSAVLSTHGKCKLLCAVNTYRINFAMSIQQPKSQKCQRCLHFCSWQHAGCNAMAYGKAHNCICISEFTPFPPRVNDGVLLCDSNFWVCRWNPRVWPFKWDLFGSTFTWYYLFFSIYTMKFQIFVKFWHWSLWEWKG